MDQTEVPNQLINSAREEYERRQREVRTKLGSRELGGAFGCFVQAVEGDDLEAGLANHTVERTH